MKKIIVFSILAVIMVNECQAQVTRYLVKLKNKNGTPYTFANPLSYLSQRAIDRRTRYGISIDSTDLPCTPSYISSITAVPNVTVLNVSKWLNSVSIQTSDAAAITTISGFNFVQSVTNLAARISDQQQDQPRRNKFDNQPGSDNFLARLEQAFADYFNYGTSAYNEIHLHNGEFLHNIGLRGQNMQIALLDAGFTGYSNLSSFDSMNLNGQLLGTWDFVARQADVNDHTHGMQCLSTIVANIPGQFVGKAPKAKVYLYRTEDAPTEYPVEEHNWACGAERADSTGADVISTSLGYTTFDAPLTAANHVYADMNGNTTMAAIAADLAAKKGLLVFAAAGNDGSGTWHFLGTPADGDSVIAVGAVSSSGVIGSFSSYGPSSDGQIKPDVASIGVSALVQFSNNTIGGSNGTSFACPNMAGLGTCLWQGFPEYNNMKIRSALWQAGSIASAPNDRIGYGIPDMKKAFGLLVTEFSTASGSVSNCKTTLSWSTKDVSSMRFEIERKAPGETNFFKVADVSASPNVSLLEDNMYQKTDSLINVQAGTISYRIRQVLDTSAAGFSAVYLDTVNINLAASCIVTSVNPVDPNNNKISIKPNPARSQFILRVETANPIQNLVIHIVDMKGRTLLQFNRNKSAGAQEFELPIYRLSKGKYIVSVYNGQQLLASKELIKL